MPIEHQCGTLHASALKHLHLGMGHGFLSMEMLEASHSSKNQASHYLEPEDKITFLH